MDEPNERGGSSRRRTRVEFPRDGWMRKRSNWSDAGGLEGGGGERDPGGVSKRMTESTTDRCSFSLLARAVLAAGGA